MRVLAHESVCVLVAVCVRVSPVSLSISSDGLMVQITVETMAELRLSLIHI